jgi:hypothetical protein
MSDNFVIGSNTEDAATNGKRAIGDTIAMQMAAITYCSTKGPNSVKETFRHYFPTWQLVWEPVNEVEGNYAFIAHTGAQYVIAIRGSILQFSWASFDNWFREDFNILEQKPWIYTQNPAAKPMISKGAYEGLLALNSLKNAAGEGIYAFLQRTAFRDRGFICVTGHSLGGNLCTVYALWLHYQMQQALIPMPGIFSVLSFAAPTSWNQAFVDEFTAAFTNSWRYYNVIDIVPFSATSVDLLGFLYGPPAPLASNISTVFDKKTVTLAEAFIGIQALILASEVLHKSYYAHVNQTRGAVELNTAQHVYKVNHLFPLLAQWFEEAAAQHDHNHYLDWLGGKGAEVDCKV